MASRQPVRDHVLADSRATLRQVSGVLEDLDDGPVEGEMSLRLEQLDMADLGPEELMKVLLEAYGELVQVIETLRESRGALHRAALERLARTHEKLQEVTSTTELAASDMLDGLDRALGLIDDLEDEGDAEKGAPTRQALREELHGLISLLQFQDITSQQLGYASGVLMEVEKRLLAVREVLARGGAALPDLEPEVDDIDATAHPVESHAHCDPNASTSGADDRQALADEIFG